MDNFTNDTNIPVEKQIKFNCTGDKVWNLDELPLTRAISGDYDNGVYMSYLDSSPEEKKKKLLKYCKPNIDKVIEAKLFGSDVTSDVFRDICYIITLYDAITTVVKGSDVLCSVNDLLFAALVNYNYSVGRTTNRIRSYGALSEIKRSEMANNDGAFDYREYIISGSNNEFENEYVAIKIDTTDYSCNLTLYLPIIQCRLGRFRFATERIAARMTWYGDTDNTEMTVPPHIWMAMIEDGVSQRLSAKFFKGEAKNLSKYVDSSPSFIDEICDMNDCKVILSFINAYDIEVNDIGEIELYNTKELPKIEKKRLVQWEEIREGSSNYALASNFFYVARITGSTIQIRMFN